MPDSQDIDNENIALLSGRLDCPVLQQGVCVGAQR
jgi:hypothetical protein